MEKFLVQEFIGEFFTKMYKENKGKNMEVTLKMDENTIQIYNRDKVSFKDIKLVEERPTIDGLVKSLSE